MKIHLDTDFGGDPDDACALAMLLGRPDVVLAGITTVLDVDGERARCVRTVLEMCGRTDIPVAAGAATPLHSDETFASTADDARYWPQGLSKAASSGVSAAQLIAANVAAGASVVAIGPYTNLAVTEDDHPGTLRAADVVVMGGWIKPPADGFPQWGPERDFNVQTDVAAAMRVFEEVRALTLSTLPETMPVQLTERQLDAIGDGPLGSLLAWQSRLHAEDSGKAELRDRWRSIAGDFVNFHWDPVACAIAARSDAVVTSKRTLAAVMERGVLRFVPSASGREVTVLEAADPDRFADEWVSAVRAVDR